MRYSTRAVVAVIFIAHLAASAQAEVAHNDFARTKGDVTAGRDSRSHAREELGRRLFFDPALSKSGKMSCATCHQPEHGFSDPRATSLGDDGGELARRTPTLIDIGSASRFFWDGRASSLEEQALEPIIAPNEMALSIDELLVRVRADEHYMKMFANAYPGEPVDEQRIASAIAAFERTIASGRAPFDDFVDGTPEAISESARRGFELFVGEARCSTCHAGWRLTDDSFHDIGLLSADLGRGKLFPSVPVAQHAFKTPTLRNVAGRPPYMHDGSLKTLQEVVRHYAEGGAVRRDSLSPDIRPFKLTEEDVADLVTFLHSLTEQSSPASMGEGYR